MKEVKTIFQQTLSIVSTTALVHFVSLKYQWNGSLVSIYIYNLFHKINVIFLVSYSETVENRNKNMDTFLLKLKFNS